MKLKTRAKDWGKILWETVKKWDSHDAMTQSAALSFYTLFSLVPILIMVIAVAGLALGRDVVREQIVHQFAGLMGTRQAAAVQEILKSLGEQQSGWLAKTVAFLTLLVSATAAFAQLQTSLNLVWEVAPKPGPLLPALLRKRMLSFALVVAIGFLLVVSLTVSAALQGLREYIQARLAVPPDLLEAGHMLTSFTVFTILFALIFRILPDADIPWKDVWLGALVTSLLLSAGKFLIGLYLGRTALSSPFGAAGSLVVLLLWVYYASLILLFGAEFTRVYSRRVLASRPPPSEGTERVKTVAVTTDGKKRS
ncbi:MAG: YihY/virulence factor BrkB family protein [Acidobacteriota bacterium]